MSAFAVRAGVSDGTGNTEVRELPLTTAVSRIRVESSAVCGTDVTLHDHGLKRPAVLGHHTIGRVDHLTPGDEKALGITVGTRVALEEYVGCGHCAECRSGRYRLCPAVDLWTGGERVGMIPVDRGSGLHGGNAEYMEISSRHVLHELPDDLASEMAAWTLPLANGVDWTIHAGGAGPGKTVVVIGPGYHGLSCVAAALASGADRVLVVGSTSAASAERLKLAREMGALTETSDEGTSERITGALGQVDAVIDTVGHPSTMASAVRMLGRSGVLVIAGLSGGDASLDTAAIVRNLITVKGVRGRSPQAVTKAIELLAGGRTRLDSVPTHRVPLEDIGATLRAMKEGRGPVTPHIVIDPWLPVESNSELLTGSAK